MQAQANLQAHISLPVIKDRGGDWLFTLKANRPVQHAEVRAWFADPDSKPHGEHTTTDADNERIEVAAMLSAMM